MDSLSQLQGAREEGRVPALSKPDRGKGAQNRADLARNQADLSS